MYNSTIKRKKCKCSDTCDKFPSMGYKGYFSGHLPQEIKDADPEKFKRRDISIRNRSKINDLSRKIHKYQNEINLKNEPRKSCSKTLLRKADEVFSKFIRKRDSDIDGNVKCICCGYIYNVKDKDDNGDYIVQAMHFVARGVSSLRFSEFNVYAGCTYCNRDMNDFPIGIAYKQFKEKLYLKLGVAKIWIMEAERRNINKLTHSDLEDIIEKYKNKK